ncbi:Sugar transporter [Popillia japonica]|uniref:Sugar transporter n=1 Tax=Popillia japonica TaxID=7064 RepID=A0AAW1KY04_POPJA
MKLEDIKNTRYMQYLAAISASLAIGANTVYTTWLSPSLPFILLASLAIGANTVYTTWLSPSLPKLQSEDSPLGYAITDVKVVLPLKAEASWVVAVGLLGSVIICPLSGLIIKKIGPKRSSLYGSVVLLIPWIPIILAKSVWLLYISRFIAGCATGIVTTAVTIYNSEIADQEIRGKLSNFFTIIKLIAHFIVLALGPFVSYAAICVICALFPLCCICSFYFMPESPLYA